MKSMAGIFTRNSGWLCVRRVAVWGALAVLAAASAAASDLPGLSSRRAGFQVAQFDPNESYTVRPAFPRDGSRFEVYDRSGRRTSTIQKKSSGFIERWDIYDANNRRIGEAQRNGSSIAPRWDLRDLSGRRTGHIRETGPSIAPRWDIYDENNRRIGSVRPGPLDSRYFQEDENKRLSIPAVPALPASPEPDRTRQDRFRTTVPPAVPPSGRWPVPGPWIQPPVQPGSGISSLPDLSGRMPVPPIPPVPPVPPVSPAYPQPPVPAVPQNSWNGNSYQGYGHGNIYSGTGPGGEYQGYGHGNGYSGYGHGNPYDHYSHGGIYTEPAPER